MTATRPDYSCVALVDISYIATRNIRAAGIKAPANAGAERTMSELLAIRDDVDHVILCADRPPYLRRDRFEGYKAHREEPPHEEIMQKRALMKELDRRGFIVAGVAGYEADDVIATLASRYSEWCPEVRIFGPDKDAAQCIRANVVQCVPASGKRQAYRRDAKRCIDDFGVGPTQMPLLQALMGDGSDGIPGVKGIGKVGAVQIVKDLVAAGHPATLAALATMLGEQKAPGGAWKFLVAEGAWASLKISLDLAVLDTNVPLDAEALLLKREPATNDQDTNPGDVDLFEFESNTTPLPEYRPADDALPLETPPAQEPPSERRGPLIGKDPNADRILREKAAERDRIAANVQKSYPMSDTQAAAQADKVIAGDPARQAPATPPANDAPTRPAIVKAGTHEVSASALAKMASYGIVTTRLQPTDLTSAATLAKWFFDSGNLKNHENAMSVFMVLQRAVELGIDVGAALGAFHVIQGKVAMSADLIRAMAKKHPDCEYFYCESSDEQQATWVTRNRKHPVGVVQRVTYTIEEARQIPDLWKKDRWGGPSMWEKRPKQMLNKTASSILARQEWEETVMGMYCPEEMGAVIDTQGVAA